MCNKCSCDHYDLCSIVGMAPIGFCCENCENYDEAHTCPEFMCSQGKSSLIRGSVCCESDRLKKISPEKVIYHL